jgi:ERF superfamily
MTATETVADMAERIALDEQIAKMTIHQRMVAILGEMPAIGKDQRNEQQRFMYRGHDDVMNALNPLLAKYGVFVIPDVIERVVGERQTERGKTMYEVNLHVRFTFYGASGDSIKASAWGEGTDMGDKSTNKAMTMAFKNVLAQSFAVSSAEFSDTDGHTPEETTRRAAVAEQNAIVEKINQGTFDPRHELLPDAPRGEGFKAKIASQLEWMRPDVDWPATIIGLPGERGPQFYLQLANATQWLYNQTEGKDFPPLDDAKLMEGFAWAFEGALVEIKPKPGDDDPAPLTPEEAEAMKAAMENDDIPFGNETDATTHPEK